MRQSQQPQQPQQPATATFASVALTRRGLQAPHATFASDQAWRSRGAPRVDNGEQTRNRRYPDIAHAVSQ